LSCVDGILSIEYACTTGQTDPTFASFVSHFDAESCSLFQEYQTYRETVTSAFCADTTNGLAFCTNGQPDATKICNEVNKLALENSADIFYEGVCGGIKFCENYPSGCKNNAPDAQAVCVTSRDDEALKTAWSQNVDVPQNVFCSSLVDLTTFTPPPTSVKFNPLISDGFCTSDAIATSTCDDVGGKSIPNVDRICASYATLTENTHANVEPLCGSSGFCDKQQSLCTSTLATKPVIDPALLCQKVDDPVIVRDFNTVRETNQLPPEMTIMTFCLSTYDVAEETSG